jgi:hypothetical protein
MNGSEIRISLLYRETAIPHVWSGSVKIAAGRPDFWISVLDARVQSIRFRAEELTAEAPTT